MTKAEKIQFNAESSWLVQFVLTNFETSFPENWEKIVDKSVFSEKVKLEAKKRLRHILN